MNAIKYHILSLTTMKICIGCEKWKEHEFFYKEKGSCCKECINKYQKEWRRKLKEEKEKKEEKEEEQSEDIIIKIIDKLYREKYSSFNEDIFRRLEEIDDKLDKLIIRSRRADK